MFECQVSLLAFSSWTSCCH